MWKVGAMIEKEIMTKNTGTIQVKADTYVWPESTERVIKAREAQKTGCWCSEVD